MSYGAIANTSQTAQATSYDNAATSSIITSDNVQGAIDQLFQSVSNGKSLIAGALTDKGISTSASDSWETIAGNISNLSVHNIQIGEGLQYAGRQYYVETPGFTASNFICAATGLSSPSLNIAGMSVVSIVSLQGIYTRVAVVEYEGRYFSTVSTIVTFINGRINISGFGYSGASLINHVDYRWIAWN